MKKKIMQVFLLLVGATLTTLAEKYVYDPGGLVTGGVSGLSIIVRYLSEMYLAHTIPLWAGNLIFNIPVFIYAAAVSGWKSVLRTGFVWAVMTAELYFLPEVSFLPDNLFLTAVYGSILVGLGSGLLLTAHATSGGSDMLSETLHRHALRSVSVGRILQVIDGIVVLIGLMVFGIERTLYAIISVYICGKVVDLILGRGKHAKMAMIVSDKNEAIARDILSKMNRGVTALKGRGMYTGEQKDVLVCICSNRDLVDLKDLVRSYDTNAFFTVAEVSEAMGEGFAEEWT